MFLLDTVAPAEATGKTAEVYAAFPKEIGVPLPLQLLSASPGLLERQFELIKYYMGHPNLTFPLLAAISYVAAAKAGHTSCVQLNGGMLMKMGMTPDQMAQLADNPQDSPLEERETAMFSLVIRAVDAPSSITAADLDAVRGHGYTDADILDAMAHAANMTAGALLYKTFVRE